MWQKKIFNVNVKSQYVIWSFWFEEYAGDDWRLKVAEKTQLSMCKKKKCVRTCCKYSGLEVVVVVVVMW